MLQARTAIARSVGTCVLLLLAITLQIMVFPRIGALPNPMICIAAVVCTAVFAGHWSGGAAGAVCGMLCDALLPGVEAYFTVTLMAAGAVTGILCAKYLQKNFVSSFVLSAVFICAIGFFFILLFQIAPGRAPWSALWTVGLPETLAGIAATPLVYPVFRGLNRVFPKEVLWKKQN
jgi:rod shape-determining protein MreD